MAQDDLQKHLIKDEDVDSLEMLEKWLGQEYPNKMILLDIPEFERVKLAGAQELALYITDMLRLNRGEKVD